MARFTSYWVWIVGRVPEIEDARLGFDEARKA